MNNWPFQRRQARPWWLPVLGVYSALAVAVLLPVVVLLLAFFALLVYGFASTGGVGIFVAAFMVVGLIAIILAVAASGRS